MSIDRFITPRPEVVSRLDDGELMENRWFLAPVCTLENQKRIHFIGTGFFFAANMLATAKHVVLEDGGGLIAELFAYHFLPGNKYYRRPIVGVAYHESADVAAICLAPLSHRETGAPLLNPRLKLTETLPAVGESVSTCAYPDSVVALAQVPVISLNTKWETGCIEAVFPNGRDRVLKPEPCLQTSLALKGGTSGGPVFDSRGRCFAINSTSFDNNRPSFVSPVGAILSLTLGPEVVLLKPNGDKIKGPSIRLLVDAGQVLVD